MYPSSDIHAKKLLRYRLIVSMYDIDIFLVSWYIAK